MRRRLTSTLFPYTTLFRSHHHRHFFVDQSERSVFHFAGGKMKQDRKSTRLNSSHRTISYAVFCLKKKKTKAYSAITAATNDTGSRCTAQPNQKITLINSTT